MIKRYEVFPLIFFSSDKDFESVYFKNIFKGFPMCIFSFEIILNDSRPQIFNPHLALIASTMIQDKGKRNSLLT